MTKPFQLVEDVATFVFRVQPGASRSEPAGWHGDAALRLRIAAPPVDGKANKACTRYLAKALGVPVSAVQIVRGESSRDKTIRVKAVGSSQYRAFLSNWDALP